MSAARIILASLPSFCKKYQTWWKFDKVLTKTNLHSFLRHGVFYMYPRLYDTTLRSTLRLKKVPAFRLSVTSSNLNRFSKFYTAGKRMKFATKPI